MAKFAGTAAVVRAVIAGGTVTITPNFTNAEMNYTADTIEVSAGNETHRSYIPGMASWDATVELFVDDASTGNTGGTADLNKFAPRTLLVFELAPRGTATGAPRYGGSAVVTEAPMTVPYGASDAVKTTINFQGIGTPYWWHGSAY